jgi:hypothetical protein
MEACRKLEFFIRAQSKLIFTKITFADEKFLTIKQSSTTLLGCLFDRCASDGGISKWLAGEPDASCFPSHVTQITKIQFHKEIGD